MEPIILNYNLNEILGDLAIYQNPDLLKDEYGNLLDTSKMNLLDVKKYQELLSNIDYFFKKTLKYELYFQEFYSTSDKIGTVEALNHHIHSYLEDSDILKNKIEVFLGTLKNDIKETLENNKIERDNIDEFFKAGIDKTKEVFLGVSEHRNPHHHNGMRFIDGDLLKAENAHNQQKILQSDVFSKMINQEKLPEFIEKLQKEEEESFENAKIRWIKIAKKNNEQASGYLNSLFETVSPSLYQFLKIKPSKEIIELQKLKNEASESKKV